MRNSKVFGVKGKEIFTDTFLHPGELLREELEARGISQREFAETIGLRQPHLNALINGKRGMSPGLALRIEKKLKINAEIWMRLQTKFDLDKARKRLKSA